MGAAEHRGASKDGWGQTPRPAGHTPRCTTDLGEKSRIQRGAGFGGRGLDRSQDQLLFALTLTGCDEDGLWGNSGVKKPEWMASKRGRSQAEKQVRS